LIKDNCQCQSQRESALKEGPPLHWWNYEGIIYYEHVPDGRMINAEVYSQQLEKMYMVLLEKHPALVNQKRVLLQQDNACPHTVKKTL
jgi:hypothetical protein